MKTELIAVATALILTLGSIAIAANFGTTEAKNSSCNGNCTIIAKNLKMEDIDHLNLKVITGGGGGSTFDDSALKQKDAALQAQLDAFGAQLQNLSSKAITSIEAINDSGNESSGGTAGNTTGGGGVSGNATGNVTGGGGVLPNGTITNTTNSTG